MDCLQLIHSQTLKGLEFTTIRKGPDPMATDYEQRLKKTDLFMSDFVPTEYTEYTPHQSAFLKQIQKRALVEYEHDEMTNTIIVNDDLKPLTTSRWFSVGICKYKPGYKSHDLL